MLFVARFLWTSVKWISNNEIFVFSAWKEQILLFRIADEVQSELGVVFVGLELSVV